MHAKIIRDADKIDNLEIKCTLPLEPIFDKTKEEIGEIEDTTKYGEFVSSYFAWLTLDRQKKTARKLENITKKNNKE